MDGVGGVAARAGFAEVRRCLGSRDRRAPRVEAEVKELAAANTAVGNYFMAGDILRTSPMDPSMMGSASGATQAQKNHGMSIAAMSQYAKTIRMTMSSSGMVTAMMKDASDGTMNGMMGGDVHHHGRDGRRHDG